MLYMSFPATRSETKKGWKIQVNSFKVEVQGNTTLLAIKELEDWFESKLFVPVSLSFVTLTEERLLIESNYGEEMRSLLETVYPDIATEVSPRSKRVQEGHLKPSK